MVWGCLGCCLPQKRGEETQLLFGMEQRDRMEDRLKALEADVGALRSYIMKVEELLRVYRLNQIGNSEAPQVLQRTSELTAQSLQTRQFASPASSCAGSGFSSPNSSFGEPSHLSTMGRFLLLEKEDGLNKKDIRRLGGKIEAIEKYIEMSKGRDSLPSRRSESPGARSSSSHSRPRGSSGPMS